MFAGCLIINNKVSTALKSSTEGKALQGGNPTWEDALCLGVSDSLPRDGCVRHPSLLQKKRWPGMLSSQGTSPLHTSVSLGKATGEQHPK